MKTSAGNSGWQFLKLLSAVIPVFLFADPAKAGCDLQLTSASPCLADSSPGTPHVGDIYALRITVNVKGAPTQPFRIKWTIANVVYYFDNISVGQGNGYWWWFTWWVDLDDQIPWSVTLDPDGVSGDTNLVNNTASGTFTPIPPSIPVELYKPRLMHGSETATLSFQPGSGTISTLYVLFGVPTSHGAQNVVSVTPPLNSHCVVTAPYGVPVFEITRSGVPASVFRDTNRFVVQLSRIRVNPALLRTNTWAGVDGLSTNWTQWVAPDQRCQSTNIAITSFVQQSLPANYRTTLTPYDAARTLHRAVMKRLVYQSPPAHLDAVGVLQDGVADCGGFSALLVACLRNVGIPARCISGFWQGTAQWHVRVEFHLPGVEWLVADPTLGQGSDPTGTYAYHFGYVPNSDSYVAVDVGDAHVMPYHNFQFIQVPNWWWYGGATYLSYSAGAYLQPNGVLSLTNAPQGTLRFSLNDTPTEGSVVLQASTNLTEWSPVATNPATGNAISYSFSTVGPRRFFRANPVP